MGGSGASGRPAVVGSLPQRGGGPPGFELPERGAKASFVITGGVDPCGDVFSHQAEERFGIDVPGVFVVGAVDNGGGHGIPQLQVSGTLGFGFAALPVSAHGRVAAGLSHQIGPYTRLVRRCLLGHDVADPQLHSQIDPILKALAAGPRLREPTDGLGECVAGNVGRLDAHLLTGRVSTYQCPETMWISALTTLSFRAPFGGVVIRFPTSSTGRPSGPGRHQAAKKKWPASGRCVSGRYGHPPTGR